MEQISLREKKKTDTRNAIIAAATELFSTQGYDNTTLADIAQQANVSQRTIFTYFPSKEAIIFYHDRGFISELLTHLDERGDTTVIEALYGFHSAVSKSDESNMRKYIVASSPTLQEYVANMLVELEQKLATEIARERNLPLDSIQAQLIAAACRTMFIYVVEHQGDPEAPEIALRFIEAGLKSLDN